MMKRLFTTLFIALVSIATTWAEDYGVKIGGVMLTSSNYTNITAAGGFSAVKSGTITYAPNSRTLTLNNAVIETTSGTPAIYFVQSSVPYGLVLPAGTSSSITSEAGAGLAVEAPFTIKGGGVVTLKAPQDCGIFMDYTSSHDYILQIANCTLIVSGLWGIAGNDEYGTLMIDQSVVIATGEGGSVCDMKRVNLMGTVLHRPIGVAWNEARHSICNEGSTYVTTSPIIYVPTTDAGTGGGTNIGTGGDVNDDGNVNLADVTTLVNIILQGFDGKMYVDLGLPSGTLWATRNIGASSPEDYGDYFAWGETVGYKAGKQDFSWSTYRYCNGTVSTLTKYCSDSRHGYNGFTDNLTELEPADDAAYVNWGPQWRMPTKEQVEELINPDYTSCYEVDLNGVKGWRITSNANGQSIFLPYASERNGVDFTDYKDRFAYWTCSVGTGGRLSSYTLSARNDAGGVSIYCGSNVKYVGLPIRPVRAQ